MSKLMEKQLSDWGQQLDQEIASLEQGWLEMRRFKSNPEYKSRADRLEQALDIIREVRSEILWDWYTINSRRQDKEKAASG